jgi:carbonic anhydrase
MPQLRVVSQFLLGVAALGLGSQVAATAPTSASEAIARLRQGNASFVAHPDGALPIDAATRTALARGQSPFAAVLSCADSRVPPEVVFHTGLGELFVVRSAGHVSDRSVLASLEYAAEHLRVPLVAVMGHESCGAVKTAVDTPSTTSLGLNLDYMLNAIRPAVAGTASSASSTRLRAAILRNVEETINDLVEGSAALRRLGETGSVTFVGAYYELATGRVHFSEPAILPAASTKAGH